MDENLKVSFNSPQSGWMSVGLSAGNQSFVTAVSYTPYDSLRDLIEALSALLDGADRALVRWNGEPDEYDFQIEALEGNDAVRLDVVRYPDHRRIMDSASQTLFSVQSTRLGLCLPFWKALRELHRNISVDEFERNWRREFPEREMQHLTRLVRSLKHQAKTAKPRKPA